jgi:FixJ family two-component response regulator
MAGHPGKPAQGPRDHPSVARIQIQCGARWKLTDPVIEGWVNARIAAALVIAPRTVAVHVENILAKPGAGTRALAVLGHQVGDRRVMGGCPPRALWRRRVL